MSRFFGLLPLLLLLFCTLAPPAVAAGQPSAHARRGQLVLVPAGRAAKWPVYQAEAKPDEYALYHFSRRRSGPLEGVFTSAHREPWAIPARIQNGLPDPRTGVVTWKPVVPRKIRLPALGRTVVFYQSEVGGGADNDTYSTEPIPWPDGHGGTLYLRIRAEVAETRPEELLPAVRWVTRAEAARWRRPGR